MRGPRDDRHALGGALLAVTAVLAYRTLGLGDLLTAVPAIRALRRAEDRIALAAPSPLAPLVTLIDPAIEHLPVGELQVPPVDEPAVAVNLHGSGPQSHRAVLAARPRRLIAFANEAVPETAGAPRWDPDEHEVRRWCRLLATSGIPADPDDLDLRPPSPPPAWARGATLVHAGAAAPARRWPVERWAAVAAAERDAGRPILLTGSEEERDVAAQVATSAGLGPGAVIAGRTDLADLASIVAGAGRVVSGDTGVAHLATAFGTPSVILFGPTPPSRWGPPDDRPQHIALWAGRTGDPHGHRPDPGLLDIRVGDVLAALQALPELPDRAA